MRHSHVREYSKSHVNQTLPPVGNTNTAKVDVEHVQPSQLATETMPPSALNQDVGDSKTSLPLPNPGLYEDLHKTTRELFPQVFEGAKLVISKGLSSHFQVNHTLAVGTNTPYLYRFGTTYIGTKRMSPTEAFPVLLGDADTCGNVNAHFMHAITDRFRMKLLTQFQPSKCVNHQLSFDYKGGDYTLALTAGNLDPISLTGMLVCHYMQSVTQSLSLGAEIMYQRGSHIPEGEVGVMSLASRWVGQRWQLSANVSPMTGNLHACMYKKLHECLQVGTELDSNVNTRESTGTVVCQLDIPVADVTLRGQVDNNWFVSAVLEKKLASMPVTLSFSGCVSCVKNYYRVGMGVILG
ncbi:unnamed protein product [Candidula unifasciata]|uniref:Mitochondrial import receptor subunit TOM40 homolog n=1 Tax=Candidula unifasciata TaxID=100452 RepID=A0A8S3YET4_9EUPU|nr:unnamed protein product [Candidula unifasciata]